MYLTIALLIRLKYNGSKNPNGENYLSIVNNPKYRWLKSRVLDVNISDIMFPNIRMYGSVVRIDNELIILIQSPSSGDGGGGGSIGSGSGSGSVGSGGSGSIGSDSSGSGSDGSESGSIGSESGSGSESGDIFCSNILSLDLATCYNCSNILMLNLINCSQI